MKNLGAKFLRKNWRGRKVYSVETEALAEKFRWRAVRRGFRVELVWGAHGTTEIEVLTDRESRREHEREQRREDDLGLGAY